MATRIKGANSLDKELKQMIREYGEDVLGDVFKTTKKVIEEGEKRLKAISTPPETSTGSANPSTRRSWNKYSKGWTGVIEVGNNYYHGILHNKKYPSLTHLLEFGHLTRDGKRTRGFSHIEPIERWVNKTYEEELKKQIGGRK